MAHIFQFFVYIFLMISVPWNTMVSTICPKEAEKQTASQTGSLSAADELGRTAVTAGGSEKQVGMFYFLWNGEHNLDGPYDITKITAAHPDAWKSEESWMAAGGGPMGNFHHWSEPLFGYYFQSDKWVVSRHCQMLTDAGVDFIVFDCTNAATYRDRSLELIDIWYKYYKQGWNVPKLAYYTASYSGTVMNKIYDEIYNNAEVRAKYPDIDDLWFRLNGKPVIIGIKDDENLRDDVKNYFRIKAKQWPNQKLFEDRDPDGFPWMEFSGLGKLTSYFKNSPKDKSIMNVSVAQHCDSVRFSASAWYGANDHGRSWHDGKEDTSEGAVLHGYNFAEQWDYAMKLDPDIVFVTGFNEWVAQRIDFNPGVEAFGFCDNCNEEYSRDIEPSAGQLGDNYYMQLCDYIARLKKSTSAVARGEKKTIDVEGGFDQWDDEAITAVYKDYEGDTFDRDCRGYGREYYTDNSGRNDIVNMKVCEDDENVYFYVDTAEALRGENDGAWMTLFINTSGKTGYDFVVNRVAPSGGKASVEAVADGGYESVGEARIRFEGDRLMIAVSKADLGLGGDASFRFKWADNYVDGDVYSFYTKGDAAPYGRLNYVYG